MREMLQQNRLNRNTINLKRIMAYSQFTLQDAVQRFGLRLVNVDSVVDDPKPYPASPFLRTALGKYAPRAIKINTEKARSEFIVAPIMVELQEIKQNTISFFSGIEFRVDVGKGLTGRCDFIVSRDEQQNFLTAPVMTIVEAKKDNVSNQYGLGQCVAEMVAAQIFNQRNERDIPTIYGAVTSGMLWHFLKLEGDTVYLENLERAFDLERNIDELLGILLKMVEEKDM